jgi:hypothetical protein
MLFTIDIHYHNEQQPADAKKKSEVHVFFLGTNITPVTEKEMCSKKHSNNSSEIYQRQVKLQ